MTKVNGFSSKPIPFVGVRHNDKEIEAANVDHLHVDRRFISDEELESVGFNFWHLNEPYSVAAVNVSLVGDEELKTWEEPRVCLADDFGHSKGFKAGRVGLLSAEVRHIREVMGVTHLNMDCKVCPHKGTRLDNCKPSGGVLHCPAHGMEFDAETGEILQF